MVFPVSQTGITSVFWTVACAVAVIVGGLAALIASSLGVDAVVSFFVASFFSILLSWRIWMVLAFRFDLRLESQIGSSLRLLSVRLAFEPFETALKASALQSETPHPSLLRLARDLGCGLSVLSALKRLSASTHSILVKKAAMQLAFCYRQGDSSCLSALADEFSQAQSSALQRFSSRTSLASVWFETSAALLPFLLSAYILVGASFLDFTFSSSVPFFLLAVVLPLVNASLVGCVFLVSPEEC